MARPRFDTDIRPVSEFRAKAAELIEQVRNTGRPLVLTQHGHSAVVVLDVEEYEQLLEKTEVLHDVQVAEKQIAAGKGVANRIAKVRLRRSFKR